MSRIYHRAGKKGTSWYLDYQVDGRRVRKRIGRSKRLAELALADIRAGVERMRVQKTTAEAFWRAFKALPADARREFLSRLASGRSFRKPDKGMAPLISRSH